MTIKNLQHILILALVAIIIGAIMLWLEVSYRRMQSDCEKMGGRFYSISFTQNICINGKDVYELN